MRTFVISDIHGNNVAFRKALKHVKLKKTDRLIILGDFIDRGEDSKGVLDTILLLKEHNFDLVCLKGNHEQMLLDAFDNVNNLNSWIKNGGEKTLLSFLTSSINKIPSKYIDLIKSFAYYYENENFVFVHASLNMTIENPFTDIETILWEREPFKYYNENWIKNRILIHGHSPTAQNVIVSSIENKNKIICIDNGSFLKREEYGSICILELENYKYNFIR
ncbi:serine/threonine protein phosphatase 1 [Flavobacterium cutihirudinis]|uniref:Serine/threonine protein phosphatase 1 n=1 Tax=Flavobacterium cutihirudinis TaxID=1265740 RepID=A0A3D9G156_9FLAO|nr:metallophosphoesterase family protein [Flavobacterium cutihirudinis]RED26930.1 serine/threonine protein phosphatase 1 [Flavobacterium cutihirudinis]